MTIWTVFAARVLVGFFQCFQLKKTFIIAHLICFKPVAVIISCFHYSDVKKESHTTPYVRNNKFLKNPPRSNTWDIIIKWDYIRKWPEIFLWEWLWSFLRWNSAAPGESKAAKLQCYWELNALWSSRIPHQRTWRQPEHTGSPGIPASCLRQLLQWPPHL